MLVVTNFKALKPFISRSNKQIKIFDLRSQHSPWWADIIASPLKYGRAEKSLQATGSPHAIFIAQDGKHKGQPTQPAFTKTTVTPGSFSMPVQARRDGFTSQVIVKLQLL